MRTTLKIDDDVLNAARTLARGQGKTVGAVISDLARKGLRPMASTADDHGFPVFDVRDDAPPITSDLVYRIRDDTE